MKEAATTEQTVGMILVDDTYRVIAGTKRFLAEKPHLP